MCFPLKKKEEVWAATRTRPKFMMNGRKRNSMKGNKRKYKSWEIYGSPSDPKLLEEYREYLKKRLDEIHKHQSSR